MTAMYGYNGSWRPLFDSLAVCAGLAFGSVVGASSAGLLADKVLGLLDDTHCVAVMAAGALVGGLVAPVLFVAALRRMSVQDQMRKFRS